jgi:CyaY protein
MQTDHEFTKAADAFMTRVCEQLDAIDPDDLDTDLAMGVLSMEFADRSKCIMNRQTAAHQIWLAHGATAWHFDWDASAGAWVDSKGRGRLEDVLSAELTAKLGREIRIAAVAST